jgi:hypothetical protein
MKPEAFNVTAKNSFDPVTTGNPATTIPINCPQPSINDIPLSCISRFFGIGFNIYPVNNQDNIYLIEHIPTVYNGTTGSMYGLSSDNQLTIILRNEQDTRQWWEVSKQSDNKGEYFNILPFNLKTQNPKYALQYENGNLAMRPFNSNFESQKWLLSTIKITRGIPVLNHSPASMFTPEFDPYSTTNNMSASLSQQQNSQQVNEVINAIKNNIQQYLLTIGATNNKIPGVSQSSIGNKETPLNINLNLSQLSNNNDATVSAFSNVDNTTPQDVLKLLERYETTTNSNIPNTNMLYNQNDLQNAIGNYKGCSNINISDYTNSRVSTCNCNLST